jgi:catechol 2,3-dioxygenase-like lactoylglutathione lyase family enzyme
VDLTELPPRVSLVTLPVEDPEEAAAFYERLGWRRHPASVIGEVAFFATQGGLLSLWRRAAMAEDHGAPLPPAGGVCLSVNLAERLEVDAAVDRWEAAGGEVLRGATDADWGGRSAVVADPDGHRWELAWNPAWPLGPDGRPSMG